MIERKDLEYDPEGSEAVNRFGELLDRETDLEWGGGWHKGTLSALPEAAVWAGFRTGENGRQVLAGIVIMGDAITADMLHSVPIAAMENGRNLGRRLVDNEDLARIANDVVREELAKLTPLQQADRSDPVEFSRLVAEHYKVWDRAVPHPVAAMAAEAKVKAPTVHTWVREARLRGFLPPARRGKAR